MMGGNDGPGAMLRCTVGWGIEDEDEVENEDYDGDEMR